MASEVQVTWRFCPADVKDAKVDEAVGGHEEVGQQT